MGGIDDVTAALLFIYLFNLVLFDDQKSLIVLALLLLQLCLCFMIVYTACLYRFHTVVFLNVLEKTN